jgi:ferredoxin
VKVSVDEDRCAGHGVCIGLCPEVFELTAEGYAIVIVADVPKSLETVVRKAVDQCPTRAISVE